MASSNNTHDVTAPAVDADIISELNDDKFAVSRRDAVRRLIAAVDATLLARRATASEGSDDVDVMEISLVYSSEHNCLCIYGVVRRYYFHDHRHEADITLSRVDGWLRFAERHVKGSFILELPLVAPVAARTPRRGEARSQAADTAATLVTDDGEAAAPADEEVVVVELPRSTRAETMSLTLRYATASVPAAAVAGAFRALTELTLQHAIIDDDGGDLRLGHLLSSPCCPRLRRLSLRHVGGVATLRLDAATALEELRLVHLPDLRWLDVDAPGLRLLRVGDCSRLPYSDSSAMAISAPRLEVSSCESLVDPERLEFDGAAAVRRIKKLRLMSFGGGGGDDQYDANAAAVWLLKNCNAVVHLGVSSCESLVDPERLEFDGAAAVRRIKKLRLMSFGGGGGDDQYDANAAAVWLLKNCNAVVHLGVKLDIYVDEGHEDTIKDVPQLPSVTSLTIKVSSIFDGHAVGASLAKFIVKCNNIQYLHIDYSLWPEDWEDQMISLNNLRVVDIRKFASLDDQISLIQLLFASSPSLDTMTVELDYEYLFHRRRVEGKDYQFDMPCYQGYWEPCAWEFGVHRFNGVSVNFGHRLIAGEKIIASSSLL
uniref:FBD domain-containing protein n=1 Tax=Oryza meridionalis TaxID=40149 RepID=A0A0E0FCM9_9ORYZ